VEVWWVCGCARNAIYILLMRIEMGKQIMERRFSANNMRLWYYSLYGFREFGFLLWRVSVYSLHFSFEIIRTNKFNFF
jgi:hypothetical protein